MSTFHILASIVSIGLTVLCFSLPYKLARKTTAWLAGIFFLFLIAFALIGNWDSLVIFFWPPIILLQLLFVGYWYMKIRKSKS